MDITKTFGNFSKLSLTEQLKIKTNGRPLPDITIESLGSSRGKNYIRNFNREIYSRINWICGCDIKNRLFCFPCLLFGNDDKWTKIGVNDLVHLSDRIKSHENTKKHILSVMRLALLGATNIESQLDSAYQTNIKTNNQQVAKNRRILSKIIDCVKLCGAFELALRLHDQNDATILPNSSEFLEINFTQEIDKIFQEHLQKDTSKDIQQELLECMLEVYHEEIKKEIVAASFLAVMIDETTEFQISIIIRYVQNSKPVERFWGFLCPIEYDAQSITNSISSVLDPLIEKTPWKLISQSYDGAVALNGQANRIRKKYRYAHFVHSYTQQLHLIIAQASSHNEHARVFFSNIQDIAMIFAHSTQCVDIFNSMVEKEISVCDFESRTVNVVCENREQLIKCMEAIAEGRDAFLINKARAIMQMLGDEKFLYWLTFFHYIMPHVEALFNKLQKRVETYKDIDVDNLVTTAVSRFKVKISEVRQHKIAGIENEVSEIASIKRRRLDTESKSFMGAFEVCDVISKVVVDRFSFAGHLFAEMLFFAPKFSLYNEDFPDAILDHIVTAYGMLDKKRLKNELSIIYEDLTFQSLAGAATLLNFIVNNDLKEAFSEITKLLKIIITTPMETMEADRSFSTLERIKRFLRNSVSEDYRTVLAVFAIESEFIKEIPNFNEKVIEKFMKKESHGMELVYKN